MQPAMSRPQIKHANPMAIRVAQRTARCETTRCVWLRAMCVVWCALVCVQWRVVVCVVFLLRLLTSSLSSKKTPSNKPSRVPRHDPQAVLEEVHANVCTSALRSCMLPTSSAPPKWRGKSPDPCAPCTVNSSPCVVVLFLVLLCIKTVASWHISQQRQHYQCRSVCPLAGHSSLSLPS